LQRTLTSREVRIAFTESQRTFEEPHEELVFSEFIECLARIAVEKWYGDAMSFHQKFRVTIDAVIGLSPMIKAEIKALKDEETRRKEGGEFGVYVPPTHTQIGKIVEFRLDKEEKKQHERDLRERLHRSHAGHPEPNTEPSFESHELRFKHTDGFTQDLVQMQNRLHRQPSTK
jgi:hypothetical protein